MEGPKFVGFCSLLFLCFISPSLCASGSPLILHDDNYEQQYQLNVNTIVYFTNNELSDEEKNFLQSLVEYSGVGVVNCRQNPDPCFDSQITSKSNLPTYRIHSYVKPRDIIYRGDPHNHDQVRSFLDEYFIGGSVLIDTSEKLALLDEGEWAVKYYAPWCQQSQLLANKWALIGKNEPFSVASVNCEGELMNHCAGKDITSLPTLLLLRDGQEVDRIFDRTMETLEIVAWIKAEFTEESHDEL